MKKSIFYEAYRIRKKLQQRTTNNKLFDKNKLHLTISVFGFLFSASSCFFLTTSSNLSWVQFSMPSSKMVIEDGHVNVCTDKDIQGKVLLIDRRKINSYFPLNRKIIITLKDSMNGWKISGSDNGWSLFLTHQIHENGQQSCYGYFQLTQFQHNPYCICQLRFNVAIQLSVRNEKLQLRLNLV